MTLEQAIEKYREIMRANMEDEELPRKVAEFMDEHAGKRFTRRLLPKLQEATGRKWGIGGYDDRHIITVDGEPRWSFTFAEWQRDKVVPTAEQFRQMNPADFSGAEKRNARRRAYINSLPDKTRRAIEALCKLDRAYREALHAVRAAGGSYEMPDYYDLRRAVLHEHLSECKDSNVTSDLA